MKGVKGKGLFLVVVISIFFTTSFALVPLEWDYRAFDDFNVENSFNFGMRRSQLFFLEAGVDGNTNQNMLPLFEFIDVLGSDEINLSEYAETIMDNIGDGPAVGGGFVRGLGNFGVKIAPRMAVGAYADAKLDAGFSVPNWIMEVLLEGNELIKYPKYDEKGPILDSSVSIGGMVGFDLGWGFASFGVGAYGPLMYGTLDRYAELNATPTAAGTVSLDATVYSPIAVDLMDFSNIKLEELDIGGIFSGVKTDFSVVAGKDIPICGVTLRDIPITSAELRYSANLFDVSATFTSDPPGFATNTTIPENINLTEMSTPTEYWIKPTVSAFVNFPFSRYFSMIVHTNTSQLAGSYVGVSLNANMADAMIWTLDLTTSSDGSMMYSGGLGIHNGLNTIKVNGGIGTAKPFDFSTVTAPRFSISTSVNF